jgi:hypothetical protein
LLEAGELGHLLARLAKDLGGGGDVVEYGEVPVGRETEKESTGDSGEQRWQDLVLS